MGRPDDSESRKGGLTKRYAVKDKAAHERIAERARRLTHVPENRWTDVVWFEEEE